MSIFDELIEVLSKSLNIPLHVEKGKLCRLNINEVMRVQIEWDELKEKVLIASFLCELPPGKFRENALKEALKTNNQEAMPFTLAYSERNNQLAAFVYYPISSLKPEFFLEELLKFVEKADLWRVAVERGDLAAVTISSSGKESPFFGMKRP